MHVNVIFFLYDKHLIYDFYTCSFNKECLHFLVKLYKYSWKQNLSLLYFTKANFFAKLIYSSRFDKCNKCNYTECLCLLFKMLIFFLFHSWPSIKSKWIASFPNCLPTPCLIWLIYKGKQCPVQQYPYHLCRSASECHWFECDSKT